MGSAKYKNTEGRREEITTWQATSNLRIKNMLQRRKMEAGIVKDLSRQRKTTKQSDNGKDFAGNRILICLKTQLLRMFNTLTESTKHGTSNRNVIHIYPSFRIDFNKELNEGQDYANQVTFEYFF